MSDHKEFICSDKSCVQLICMTAAMEAKYRRERSTFYCPAGHSNYFPGKTEEEKTIERLQRAVGMWRDLYDGARADVADLRQQRRVCPFECGFVVQRKSKPENIRAALVDHLSEVHDAVPVEVEEDALVT